MLIDSIKKGPVKLLDEITIKDAEGVNDIVLKQILADLSPQEKSKSPPLQSYAPIVVQQPPIVQPDTGLAIPTFLPKDDPIASLNKAMIFLSSVYRSKFPPTNNQLQTSSNPRTQATIQNGQVTVQNVQGRQSQGYAGNAGNNQASGARVINTVGNAGANQPRVIRCYNCNGEGHMAKQCTARKRVKDFEWYKDKMLLAQAQEVRVVLNEEQQDFLDVSLEETDDYCDGEATSNAIFMENLYPIGSLNDDMVEPRYYSDIHSEVPYYDTYHDSDMLNSNIQDLGYIKNSVSNNESYDKLKGNSNVISYTDYMLTIGNDEDNYVPPPIQKNDMMLSVIEQMKSQVEKCNMVNQESKSMNESLTSELERYKDRVRLLEYAVKDGHYEQEAYLKSRLKMLEKQTVVNTKRIDYFKLNKLYEFFVPQTQLSAEQLYWSSITSPPVMVSKPKVYPKKLPSTSQVLRNLNKARDLLTKFDECIKKRTTLSPHEIGSLEQSDIKEVKEMNDIFEQIEDEVD
ncbi:integrase, catalytic region, zinc finger, CCHC-type containing protein [Tanacetum coccineum]